MVVSFFVSARAEGFAALAVIGDVVGFEGRAVAVSDASVPTASTSPARTASAPMKSAAPCAETAAGVSRRARATCAAKIPASESTRVCVATMAPLETAACGKPSDFRAPLATIE